MILFSAVFQPTTLFSLKDSSSTNKGAKSLFLPSPYAIKMAILNQIITIGGELELLKPKKSREFGFIRDAKISYFLPENISFCISNSFVKILEQKEDKRGKKEKEAGQIFTPGFKSTISFREYIFISDNIELIFNVESEDAKLYIQQYLHRINYFGKRGCFFQFIEYKEIPNKSNIIPFDIRRGFRGFLQSYDDFDENSIFENINSFSSVSNKRKKQILLFPFEIKGSSKSFTHYQRI